MVKRFHCEFNNCNCTMFKLFCSEKCKYCNHGEVWHSLNERPSTTFKTQFISPRIMASAPRYISDKFNEITIFNPIPVVVAYPTCSNNFCITVDALPV